MTTLQQKLHTIIPLLSDDKVLKGFHNRLPTGMILIDLQNVFNTIKHDSNCGKIHSIGFSAETIAWFKSYLSD